MPSCDYFHLQSYMF